VTVPVTSKKSFAKIVAAVPAKFKNKFVAALAMLWQHLTSQRWWHTHLIYPN